MLSSPGVEEEDLLAWSQNLDSALEDLLYTAA
jgi:hypothetical protein